ncbi:MULTISPECIES: NtaA/DmoA family FMN-dependent monooxygenase [unclassified Microbacterium]|uniref:NtaA/DmoA family FMN-dependent monooxygenase n=1 Tax=unclassified Microbacterium TaxID=2609290 RepID=UPI00214BE5D6|nr:MULTISPECIES: NtaA/DmoA family FMN-dependent monooxygenase [unclassified Microbacterium]MCR2808417.1 NtaA/DmoA family FMN-dependent monooxygenase [Microbacterium sp. zg.B185]WIM19138.1 NtaA/DmoA family FMN-dependent monooxygenase [Microbacterium sp. zg-B185]
MILTMFMLTTGFQIDSWRAPRSRSDELPGLGLITDMAAAAEAAKIHAVFFGDSVDVGTIRDNNIRNTGLYEPISAIGALIGATSRIGLVGSLSTTFFEPYNAARQFSGLDHLSGGRVGWNVVTSLFGGYQNFGMAEMPKPEDRYRRATEFVDVVTALWDSWADDAVLNDRKSGQWAELSRIRDIDHHGEFYDVAGALTAPRPPQGHPVLFQAGQSPAGMRLGATRADVIYTAQSNPAAAKAFSEQMRTMAKEAGRDPQQLKILPGVVPIVASTAKEAEELSQELASWIDMDAGRRRLSSAMGADLEGLDPHETVPEERFIAGGGNSSRVDVLRAQAREGKTLRELVIGFARAGGHRILVGSVDDVAQAMIDWFDSGFCDGFNLDPPSVPEGMDRMLTLLVPALQERGYFHEEYSGSTLRESLALPRPVWQ